MLIKQRRSWELPESAATSESVYMNRREWLKATGFAGLGLATSGLFGGGIASTAMAAIGGRKIKKNVVGINKGNVIVQNLLILFLQSIIDASITDLCMACRPAKKKMKFALICFQEPAIIK